METNELFGSVYSDLSPGIGTTPPRSFISPDLCLYAFSVQSAYTVHDLRINYDV